MTPDRVHEAARELHRRTCDLLLEGRLTPADQAGGMTPTPRIHPAFSREAATMRAGDGP